MEDEKSMADIEAEFVVKTAYALASMTRRYPVVDSVYSRADDAGCVTYSLEVTLRVGIPSDSEPTLDLRQEQAV